MIGLIARARSRWLSIAALSLVGAIGSAHANGEAKVDLTAPYAFQASHQTVVDVLRRFATDHGLTVRIGADSKRRWASAELDGWVRAPSGRAFLEQLAHAHHFSWFIAERILHVSAARDSAVERIALGGMPADSARAALEAVGLYDARFGWGELTGQDAVLVGGPRAYRALVRRFIVGHANSAGERSDLEPMIFALRFAQAADGPLTGANGARRPGLATLLRQLLVREAPGDGLPAFTLPAPSDIAPLPSTAPPLAQWLGYPRVSPAPSPAPRLRASEGASADAFDAGIVADERTNSIIVWADRRWRSRLQQLVDELDRPSPLVSIDVLVVETDVSTVATLSAASDRARDASAGDRSAFDERVAEAVADHRLRLLNRQTLVGQMNALTTLAIGGEGSHADTAAKDSPGETRNGRSGNQGDRLGLAARIVPSNGAAATCIAIDVDLLMAQPTGLPGQSWANSSSVKLDTAVTLESGAPPRLIASYPVATARAEQRAIFISAKAL